MNIGKQPHNLIKEIHEQPEVLEALIAQELNPDGSLKIFNENLPESFLAEIDGVCFLACGTSYHACLVGRQYVESLSSVPAFVELASEFRFRKNLITAGTLVIAVSQSGRTTDTLEALKLAAASGAKTLALINVADSPMAQIAHKFLTTPAGPEYSVASTKVYTAQLLALLIIALRLAKAKNRETPANKQVLNEIPTLPGLMAEALKVESACQQAAKKIWEAKSLIYLARGINWPWALEAALKMKETSYIHAEGFSAGEVKHGPFALLEPGLPAIILAPRDELLEKNLKLMTEIRERGSFLIALTESDNQPVIEKADFYLPLPKTSEYFRPIAGAAAAQILAYHVARLKGLDVDSPRSLTKAVV